MLHGTSYVMVASVLLRIYNNISAIKRQRKLHVFMHSTVYTIPRNVLLIVKYFCLAYFQHFPFGCNGFHSLRCWIQIYYIFQRHLRLHHFRPGIIIIVFVHNTVFRKYGSTFYIGIAMVIFGLA